MPCPLVSLPADPVSNLPEQEDDPTPQDPPQCSSHDPVLIQYPTQTIYTCPLCLKNYAIYALWTRHLQNAHPGCPVDIAFQCVVCGVQYSSKRSIANHHCKSHGSPMTDQSCSVSGSYQCEFCSCFYPSKRSQSQHIRNQHMEEASEQSSWLWSPEEHQIFLDALHSLGPSSN